MKQVVLYTATKKLVPYTHRGYIPYVIRERVQFSINSDHAFDQADTKVHQLPIRRMCFQDEGARRLETFMAFDPELQEYIDMIEREAHWKGVVKGESYQKDLIETQAERIKSLLDQSIWSTIKYKFKQWRERNE